jgi:hypothetical protein
MKELSIPKDIFVYPSRFLKKGLKGPLTTHRKIEYEHGNDHSKNKKRLTV